MATLRQIRANQQNAARSTGPNTPEGRATCRKARLTHGLASELLLPDEEQAEADRRAAAWGPGLGAGDDYTRWLARQFAADSVRIDRLRQAEHALRARQAELAADPESWALRRRVEADALARRLRAEPQAVASKLEATAAGCAELIRDGAFLRGCLGGLGWNDDYRTLALDLLGSPRGPPAGLHPAGPARGRAAPDDHRRAVCDAELARLTAFHDEVLILREESDRELALLGLGPETPELIRLRLRIRLPPPDGAGPGPAPWPPTGRADAEPDSGPRRRARAGPAEARALPTAGACSSARRPPPPPPPTGYQPPPGVTMAGMVAALCEVMSETPEEERLTLADLRGFGIPEEYHAEILGTPFLGVPTPCSQPA